MTAHTAPTQVGSPVATLLGNYLSADERAALRRIRPLASWWMVLSNWLLVGAAFALVAWAPNPLSVAAAVVLIGARQLGLAVVMHEAAHGTLFGHRRLNDWVGNWLAAYPIWAEVDPYRTYHLLHHRRTGADDDPDLGLAAPFPITRASFWRKVWRDLSGQTGWKQARGVFRRDVGWDRERNQRTLGMSEGEQADVGWHKLLPVAVTNGVLLTGLTLAGHPALYLLWVAAWLTTYRLVSRLRSIAEHGMVPDRFDPLRNTRTTHASWWERVLVAPNRVNFHLEHHLAMGVPHHNLPALHALLISRGALDARCVAPGYAAVLRLATSRPAAALPA